MTQTEYFGAKIARHLYASFPAAPKPTARASGRLRAFDGVSLEVQGVTAAAGTVCRIGAEGHNAGEAVVIGFRDDLLYLMPLDIGSDLRPGTSVTPLGCAKNIDVGADLMGRAIDDAGLPIDGGPQPVCQEQWPLTGQPFAAASVTAPFSTGVRAIDAALTMGEGQRIGIVAPAGTGKTSLVGMISAFADVDVIVLGLIGERGREVADAIAAHMGGPQACRTVIVAASAERSPVRRLRGADRATAIAEYFRAQGKRVLLVIDSLTRLAHAQREVGLSMGEPPTAKGYPPSVFGLIPRLVERAGAATGGGSITGVYTILADSADIDGDPVVDSARAILDGHILLSPQQARRGVYPAIDMTASISRVMQGLVPAAQMNAASQLRRLIKLYDDNQDLMMMGAYAAGSNAELDFAVARRDAIDGFIGQPSDVPVPADEGAAALSSLISPPEDRPA